MLDCSRCGCRGRPSRAAATGKGDKLAASVAKGGSQAPCLSQSLQGPVRDRRFKSGKFRQGVLPSGSYRPSRSRRAKTGILRADGHPYTAESGEQAGLPTTSFLLVGYGRSLPAHLKPNPSGCIEQYKQRQTQQYRFNVLRPTAARRTPRSGRSPERQPKAGTGTKVELVKSVFNHAPSRLNSYACGKPNGFSMRLGTCSLIYLKN